MTGEVFVDTNVLVYARDASEPIKQRRAALWVEHLWATRSGRTGVQVLNEYYVTVTRKLQPGMPRLQARADVQALRAWNPVAVDPDLMERAFTLEDVASLSWWDALIVAAAHGSMSRYILSEDLPTGQLIDGIRIISPFDTEPVDLEEP